MDSNFKLCEYINVISLFIIVQNLTDGHNRGHPH